MANNNSIDNLALQPSVNANIIDIDDEDDDYAGVDFQTSPSPTTALESRRVRFIDEAGGSSNGSNNDHEEDSDMYPPPFRDEQSDIENTKEDQQPIIRRSAGGNQGNSLDDTADAFGQILEDDFVVVKEVYETSRRSRSNRIKLWIVLFVIVATGGYFLWRELFPLDNIPLTEAESPLFFLYTDGDTNYSRIVTVVISIDGFRPDYLDRRKRAVKSGAFLAPTLRELGKLGIQAEAMITVFPSSTFPNHWSLVTGLFPENHGIWSNTMYDPDLNEWFEYGNSSRGNGDSSSWWKGEPVWETLRRTSGGKQKSAIFYWPGSEITSNNFGMPDFHPAKPYNASIAYEERVDTMLDWVQKTSNNVALAMLYFNGVDAVGHVFGPNSVEVDDAIQQVDQAILRFMKGMRKTPDIGVNYIIVSDHGMAERYAEDTLNLTEIFPDPGLIQIVDLTPITLIYPVNENTLTTQEIYDQLNWYLHRNRRGLGSHFQVYLREELPDRFFIPAHAWPPITIVSEVGYGVSFAFMDRYLGSPTPPRKSRTNEMGSYPAGVTRGTGPTNSSRSIWGEHGYDNMMEDMDSFFIAQGPSFDRHKTSGIIRRGEINSYDVYTIICQSLKIPARDQAPNNSTQRVSKRLFREYM